MRVCRFLDIFPGGLFLHLELHGQRTEIVGRAEHLARVLDGAKAHERLGRLRAGQVTHADLDLQWCQLLLSLTERPKHSIQLLRTDGS